MTAGMPADTWVVVPAYNEAAVLERVVRPLAAEGFRVVVIDDGSSDETAATAATLGVAVLRHAINLGQGAALQTGIDYALGRGARYILTFDADGQHRVDDLFALLEPLVAREADFTLGSRFLRGTPSAPWQRRWVLRLACWFTRIDTGLPLTDAHNGLRGMTRRGAQGIRLRQNRMAHASEIVSQIAASGLRFVEVPVKVEYTAYSLAKGQRLRGSVDILFDLVRQGLIR